MEENGLEYGAVNAFLVGWSTASISGPSIMDPEEVEEIAVVFWESPEEVGWPVSPQEPTAVQMAAAAEVDAQVKKAAAAQQATEEEAAAAGHLFQAAQQVPLAPSVPLCFESPSFAPSSTAGGGIFGAAATASPAPSGGIFGAAISPAPLGGMFGAAAATTVPGGSPEASATAVVFTPGQQYSHTWAVGEDKLGIGVQLCAATKLNPVPAYIRVTKVTHSQLVSKVQPQSKLVCAESGEIAHCIDLYQPVSTCIT